MKKECLPEKVYLKKVLKDILFILKKKVILYKTKSKTKIYQKNKNQPTWKSVDKCNKFLPKIKKRRSFFQYFSS